MKNKKRIVKHTVTFAAIPAELAMLERIKQYHKRRTNTDAIRFLVEQESEKILSKNMAIANNTASSAK